MLHSSPSIHPPLVWVPVFFRHSTEQNHKTSAIYINSFQHVGDDFSCAFGLVVVFILEFGQEAVQYYDILCNLKPQRLLDQVFCIHLRGWTTCLRRNLVAAVDSFLFLPPSNYVFCFLYPLPCQCWSTIFQLYGKFPWLDQSSNIRPCHSQKPLRQCGYFKFYLKYKWGY